VIDRKIKHGWGYDCGPFPPNVVLSHDGTNYLIEYWPTDNPPMIEEIEAVELPYEPTPVPTSVSPAQIRIWLISQGIALSQVDGFIDAIEDATQREIARTKWEYGLVVLRTDPLVIAFATALGMTESQMDAAFLAATKD
jgi:hypothetical protein